MMMALPLLLTIMGTSHVAIAMQAPPTPTASRDGKITFPLLTHHRVITRHLAESGRRDDESHRDHRPATLRRRLPQGQQQLGSLYQGYGTHYMDIWVGYPPQRQTAVVDTGSSVTAFPCSTCTDCGTHADRPFNESQSETFHMTPCVGETGRPCVYGGYGQCDMAKSQGGECWLSHQYGDANSPDSSGWTAYEAEDVAYAAGLHDAPVSHVESGEGDDPGNAAEFSFALTFGCQTEVTGYFEKQLASGVMGLDRRAQSFWGQMRSQQVIHRARFSLCFVRQPLASKAGTTAGAVTLGGVDERLNLSPMVYAKTVTEGGDASFKVRVRKMYLRENGGSSVMYDGTSAYHALELETEDTTLDDFDIDSGTTDTYLISAISGEFRRVWKDITRTEYTNTPVKLSEDQLRKLPTVMLQIIPHEGGVGDEVTFDNPAEIKGLAGKVDYGTPNDILFAIPAVHYMQHNGDGTYTARIYLDRENAAGSILGANAMMGHNILFDVDSGRIGLAESECDYARLVAEATGVPARNSEVASSSETTTVAETETTTPIDEPEICAGLKCQAFLGIACTFFFLMFFVFARRYVTKRDDFYDDDRDLEMKSARGSNGRGGGYSDDEDSYGGSRSSYRDRAPRTSYSDDRRRSGSNERSNRHSSNNSYSSGHRRSGSDDGRSSRISGDRSQQSSRSHESKRSQQSLNGSIQSHHSSRSQRSHQSNRTSSSHRSSGERSSNSRGSHGSGGSRESSRSQRSSKSYRSSRDRDPQGEYGSRRDRYYNDDEISRPPSIS